MKNKEVDLKDYFSKKELKILETFNDKSRELVQKLRQGYKAEIFINEYSNL